MQIVVNIPKSHDETEEFTGTVLPVDGIFSFFHGNYEQLADQAIAESGIQSGLIPVIIQDGKENNLAALTLEVQDGRWKSTALNGWTNDGKWDSLSNATEGSRMRGEKIRGL